MLWYKLKTWYGGEEALVKEIRRTVPPYMYKDVFVIYNERNLRRQQRSVIELEPLFKGNVFLTCEGTEPLFRRLDKIPAISRLIAAGYLSMFPLMEQDARFLEMISGEDHVVRLSYILRGRGEDASAGGAPRKCGDGESGGNIPRDRDNGESVGSTFCMVYGPLEYLLDGLEKIRFSSRFAKTHKRLWGEDVVIPLGLLLDVDVGEKALYHGVEATAEPPAADHYTVLEVGKDETGRNTYRVCKNVTVLPKGGAAGTPEWIEHRNIHEKAMAVV